MTEQELLDMFIQERINMLLATLNKTKQEKTTAENEQIFQATHFIDNLPDDKRELVDDYIEQFIDEFASEEPYLYWQGFLDAVRVINFLRKL
ncbi:hypothetical protein [Lacrimispora sphenoides]|uniref:DNA phosphorothioation-dependent restriction protein DptG n=1 Tax=Lacrimispora sphenoides JCM 1415 TaxID=1297793 RepID=A0ABY1CDT8_9FIRM|nr:hypothetical protein [Lacrimispora sphenoides]SET95500.1 DNA phosphorothioation-dependent restriction protein DptG [[Clostridium] sphenoides JCM 1415]SUY52693.1 Uncharacterised protein [Lacrimispora sphenoides]